jgi:hypothetical protein
LATPSRGRSPLASFSQHADRLRDALLSCVRLLGGVDRDHVPLLLAEGQPVEETARVGVVGERLREVRRNLDLAWLGVELDLDIQLVAGGDPGERAVLSADSQQVPVATGRDRAAEGVRADRDANRRLLARAERLDDVGGI